MKKKTIAILFSCLFLVGCSTKDNSKEVKNIEQETTVTLKKIELEKAKEIAVDSIEDLEEKYSHFITTGSTLDGKLIYLVTVADSKKIHDLQIDIYSGEILFSRSKILSSKPEDIAIGILPVD